MNWQEDDALVLDARPQGDTHAVVWLLTAAHGLHAGLVHGGQSRAKAPLLQVGNRVRAQWQARLEEQLGDYKLELLDAVPARFFEAPLVLAGIRAAAEILRRSLPERQPYPQLHQATLALLEMTEDGWTQAYVRWELGLLATLGFGLDLARCALTGTADDLAFVSPKSGRAVSAQAAAPWRERLLKLPPFLYQNGMRATGEDLQSGMELTGFFLSRYLFQDKHWMETADNLPFARHRLLSLIGKDAIVAA